MQTVLFYDGVSQQVRFHVPAVAPNNGCPAVPAHPANANVNSNIALTDVIYFANWLNPPTEATFTDAWLVSMVAPNAPFS